MIKKGWGTVFRYIVIIGLILCFFAPIVYGQGNITLGRLIVHPGIKYQVDIWDNIYSEKNDEQDDILHKFTPSISVGYAGTPGNSLNVGYSIDLVAYSDFDDNNYQTHKPYIDFGYKSPVGVYLQISDSYTYTKDPFGSLNQYNIGQNTERWNNNLSFRVGYEFEFYAVEVMYGNYVEGYDLAKDQWQERMDHTWEGSFFYNFTPKTALFFQYRRVTAEYSKQNDGVLGWNSVTSQDYSLNSYFLGVRFKTDGKLLGQIKIGYGDKRFENVLDKDGNPYDDGTSFVVETNVSYQATPKTRLSINLQRSHMGSPDGDGSTYIDTRLMLGLNQKLATRFTLQVDVDWGNNDYQNMAPGKPEKAFNTYGFFTNLTYDVQDWLKAGIEYKYQSKQANESVYENSEFDSNLVSVSIRALF